MNIPAAPPSHTPTRGRSHLLRNGRKAAKLCGSVGWKLPATAAHNGAVAPCSSAAATAGHHTARQRARACGAGDGGGLSSRAEDHNGRRVSPKGYTNTQMHGDGDGDGDGDDGCTRPVNVSLTPSPGAPPSVRTWRTAPSAGPTPSASCACAVMASNTTATRSWRESSASAAARAGGTVRRGEQKGPRALCDGSCLNCTRERRADLGTYGLP
jgi:hypothetical protein